MSSGPTLTGQTCIEATKKKYVHISISKDVFCTYTGVCHLENLVFEREQACLFCKYRKPLDIPWMIDLAMEGKK